MAYQVRVMFDDYVEKVFVGITAWSVENGLLRIVHQEGFTTYYSISHIRYFNVQ